MITFVLIGCGKIGKRHAEQMVQQGKLIAVCDIVKEHADELALQYNAKAFYCIEDLIANTTLVNVAAICTPNGLHAQHTIFFLNAHYHVLCEKPMALTVADCNKMIEAADRNNKKLFCVKQNRFNPPVAAVKKVIDDLIKFGTVQRGFLGVSFVNASDLNEEEKNKQGIPLSAEGIYVSDVPKDGGAYEAGIRKGDIIKKINGTEISNAAEMQGQISRQKPGDKLPVTYLRNGKEFIATVTLKNKAGNYEIVKAEAVLETLGADFTTLDPRKAKEYGVAGGVIVKKINEGALNDQTRMKDGFIILKVNDKEVKSVDEMKALVGSNKNITISGFYPGYDGVYEYPLSLENQ